MRIALLGGTGDIGAGLALRWGFDTDHEVLVGSRDPERARERADEYGTELEGRGVEADIKGFGNAAEVETVTPLLINVASENEGMHDLGVRFE